MVEEVVKLLKAKEGGIFLDATVGAGGHARAILSANPENRIIGIDWDEEAVERAWRNLKDYRDRVSIYHARFSQIDEVLAEEGVREVSGVLFDLGVSHFHLRGNRGFSFWENQQLDMRMDTRLKTTAKDVVNELSEEELAGIIKRFGEERFARKIARMIAKRRKEKPITTTGELAEIVKTAVPRKFWRGKHPATKTFQAIRIYVNKELEEIEIGVPLAWKFVSCGGRLVVVTFHSLEDRLVKNIMKKLEGARSLLRKPLTPSPEEVKRNPSSRSAKLRAVEKVCEPLSP